MGALSPYLNKAIKAQTTNADGTVNTEANLIAHTILGALEAKATGNSALAGGLGALTAEAAAPLIMQQLYGTDKAENLTEAQKQNITNLSQITAALSSGLATDSTAGFVAGAESGKRAVENNLLLTDTSNLKGLTRTETENHRRMETLLKEQGVENIDDYAQAYSNCGSAECRKYLLAKLDESFNQAYDKVGELAKSGELSIEDINALNEHAERMKAAYDSKGRANKDSQDIYFGGLLNVLGKNEERLNQARLYAAVANLAQQGYTEEQITQKLSNENWAIVLSSTSVAIGSGSIGNGASGKVPTISTQEIKSIVKGTVTVSKSKYPETAAHIEDSIKQGKPNILTIDRKGAQERRKEALQGIEPKKGLDRDEYPPAMFKEGGKGASVRHISQSDNRGAGSCIGHQCKNYNDGDKIKIEVGE